MTLQARMTAFLGADWRNLLLPGVPDDPDRSWRAFFERCAPDLGELPVAPEDQPVPIYPGARDNPALGAPAGAHLCKAFDRLRPDQVRVVVIGEDPYPDVRKATGRAFEDGTWDGSNFSRLAHSLRPIVRSALALSWNQPELHGAPWNWDALCDRQRDGRLNEPAARDAMSRFFDNLADEGVLCVNAAWTYTTKQEKAAHAKLWRPVTEYLIRQLAEANRPVVFLLLGRNAQHEFRRAKPTLTQTRFVETYHSSPRARRLYCNSPNPLSDVNTALRELGASQPITWWPAVPAMAGTAGAAAT